MTHIELALTGLTTICLVLLPIALVFLRRISKELVTLNKSASKFEEAGFVNVATATQGTSTLTELSDSVAEMKRDFEWLVSDRMIELAINMAGTGQSKDNITKHTGISASELDAIQKIAKH
jgi:signal transduction histidine kinase